MQGGPIQSPWVYDSGEDYLGRHLRITVPFNNTTRAIQNGTVVHRDPGCVYTTIVFANPSDQLLRKPLPAAPDGDTTLSANNVRQATGAQTIEDLLALGQITAER